jgi:hypothetical protein
VRRDVMGVGGHTCPSHDRWPRGQRACAVVLAGRCVCV